MSDSPSSQSRRNALKCLAYGGAGTLFTVAGGIFTPIDLAMKTAAALGLALPQSLLLQGDELISRPTRQ